MIIQCMAIRCLILFALFFYNIHICFPQETDEILWEDLKAIPYFTKLKKAARKPEKVYKLDLSNEGLQEFPPEILNMTNLRILLLDSNKIGDVPAGIKNLRYLKVLGLSYNKIDTIPQEISELQDLQYLYLNNNKISGFPEEITKLVNLESLFIYQNNICNIPAGISQMRELTGLFADSNNIAVIPGEIGNLHNLYALSLADNQISQIPEEFYLLTSLTKLFLQSNRISSLSSDIHQLHNLEILSLSDNDFSSLPPEIGRLGNLQELYLYSNRLAELPSSIGDLADLQILNISDNPIADLPVEMSNLKQLKELYILEHSFKSFPQVFYDLNRNKTKITGWEGRELFLVNLSFRKAHNRKLTGEYAEAISGYYETLSLDSNHAGALYELAECYNEIAEYDSCRIVCDKFMKKFSKSVYLGKIKNLQENSVLSERYYLQGDSLFIKGIRDTALSGFFHSEGIKYFRKEKYDQAGECFQKSILLDHENYDSHFYLSVTYHIYEKKIPFILSTLIFFLSQEEDERTTSLIPFLFKEMDLQTGKKGESGVTSYIDDYVIRDQYNNIVYKSESPQAELLATMIMEMMKSGDMNVDIVTTDETGKEIEDPDISLSDIFQERSNVEQFIVSYNSICDSIQAGCGVSDNFCVGYYCPYFIELKNSGYLETLANMISELRVTSEGEISWVENNGSKVELFREWNNNYNWLQRINIPLSDFKEGQGRTND